MIVLPLIGLLMVALVLKVTVEAVTTRKCPACRTRMSKRASVCPACRREVFGR